jgi:hypothetical protein
MPDFLWSLAEEAAIGFEAEARELQRHGISLFGMGADGILYEDAADGKRYEVQRNGRTFRRIKELYRPKTSR